MGKNVFLSYATGKFIEARDQLCQSAIDVGFDVVISKSYEDLEKSFCDRNKKILSQTRGAGYWLWKPQIILQELIKLDKDDVLVYSDAGQSSYYQFKSLPKNCIYLAKKYGFLLGPTIGQHGSLSKWTKRDAFILLDMDRTEIYNLPPIQATYSFWTPSNESFEFLQKWLTYCEDPRILTDIPNTQNYPNLNDFKDHRHDQTVMSLLGYKYNAPYMDYNSSLVEKILKLRPTSLCSHLFLKRIDDVENTYKKNVFSISLSLLKCFLDTKKMV